MSTLRNRLLKGPKFWLLLLILLFLLGVADSLRPPSQQICVRLFTAGVAIYHRYVDPLMSRYIHCRYQPTCSRYAEEAVRKYGIARGLRLSFRRIRSCTRAVPMGTRDPVP